MPLDHLETFGAAVKTARVEKGWTLEALAAEALGNPDRKGYCSQVEKGKRNLTEGTIRNFARALDLPDSATAPLLNRALPTDDQTEASDANSERLLTEVETLRTQLKLSEALAIALAYKYAEGNPTDLNGALTGLEDALETAAREKARDALPSNIDAAVDAVLAKVAALNDDGQTDEADSLLTAEIAATAEEVARKKRAQERLLERGIEQARMNNNADAYAERQLMLIQLDSPTAEDQFHRLRAIFTERYEEGLRKGTPFALTAAIGLAACCADIAPKPYLRAMAKHDQANALANQGLRTSGPDGASLLAQAVAAYDAALEVRTRADHPVDWAMTQNNKAIALRNQVTRTSGPEGASLLAQAVAAYDAALEVYTRADHPVDWAMTQNNKAVTLQDQGIRTSGPDGASLLAEAVAAYDAALEVYTRADYPVDWAMTQNNKATVLQDQGIRTSDPDGASLLAQAVAAYDAALEVRTRADHPVDWAMTQNNLGLALSEQGTRTSGSEGASLLEQAVAAYDAALEVRTRADQPVDWAMTQENLAIVRKAMAEHDTGGDPLQNLKAALEHVEAALEVFDPEHMSYNYTKASALRDGILTALANL